MAISTVAAPTSALRTRCLEERVAKTRAQMQAANLEVLVAYGSGMHSFVGMNPAWYLSGFKQMGMHAAVLLGLEGDPMLIMTPPWDLARARRRATTMAEVVATTDDDFLETVKRELRSRDLADKRTAV